MSEQNQSFMAGVGRTEILLLPPARCLRCGGAGPLTRHHNPLRFALRRINRHDRKVFLAKSNGDVGVFRICMNCHREFMAIEQKLTHEFMLGLARLGATEWKKFLGWPGRDDRRKE